MTGMYSIWVDAIRFPKSFDYGKKRFALILKITWYQIFDSIWLPLANRCNSSKSLWENDCHSIQLNPIRFDAIWFNPVPWSWLGHGHATFGFSFCGDFSERLPQQSRIDMTAIGTSFGRFDSMQFLQNNSICDNRLDLMWTDKSTRLDSIIRPRECDSQSFDAILRNDCNIASIWLLHIPVNITNNKIANNNITIGWTYPRPSSHLRIWPDFSKHIHLETKVPTITIFALSQISRQNAEYWKLSDHVYFACFN